MTVQSLWWRPLMRCVRSRATSTCKATGVTVAGAQTAIQIQRHYLALAHDHVHDAFMPVWAPAVCAEWSNLLDRLEGAPGTLGGTLDWAFKWTLYRNRAKRLGVEWDTLPAWTHVAEVLHRALAWRREIHAQRAKVETPKAGHVPVDRPLTAALALGTDSPLANEVRSLTPYLQSKQLRWRQLDDFLNLRQQLLEVDLRFGQVGDRTLFTALEDSAFADHGMPGVDRIDEAMDEPPLEGRARVRGQVIRRAAQEGARLACAWDYILDLDALTSIDLSDPLIEQEVWSPREAKPGDERGTGLWARLVRFHTATRDRAEPSSDFIQPSGRVRRRS